MFSCRCMMRMAGSYLRTGGGFEYCGSGSSFCCSWGEMMDRFLIIVLVCCCRCSFVTQTFSNIKIWWKLKNEVNM